MNDGNIKSQSSEANGVASCEGGVIKINCEGLCKDGLSAYDLWLMNQSPDSDTSLDNFFKSIGIIASAEIEASSNSSCGRCKCFNLAAFRGESAYETWAKNQSPDIDTSIDNFLNWLRTGTGTRIVAIKTTVEIKE